MTRRIMLPVLVALLMAMPVMGQEQGQSDSDRGRDRGESRDGDRRRGDWDPAAMRERMNNFMKERLGATDEEFKVIQPKLEKVFELQRDARGGGMFFGRGRPDSDQQPQTSAAQASRDLRDVLENENASAEEIAAKLEALRKAREGAKKELAGAQKELKELLTQRQEAVLVTMGLLE